MVKKEHFFDDVDKIDSWRVSIYSSLKTVASWVFRNETQADATVSAIKSADEQSWEATIKD